MSQSNSPKSAPRFFALLLQESRWLPTAVLVGIMAGTASAILLASLNLATALRTAHPWLILLLGPVGGVVGLMYRHYGASVEAGNNLILEQVHRPSETIRLRMTPLILLGTFLTHLFGGSAGREGTAIQTGASLADQLTRPLRLDARGRRVLLMAGISAGFGSVFGTPLAGAVFGMEVLAVGQISYEAVLPCFIASFVGDLATRAWGIQHTVYRVTETPTLTPGRLCLAMLAGAAFGLIAMIFAQLTQAIVRFSKRRISYGPLRPVLGGLAVTTAAFGLGLRHTEKYLGLGVPTIVAAFSTRLPPYDFAAKLLFTAVTLGTGFKGGEVTPLFYIGATSGNALARLLPLPPSLLAGMGFVAVFAGAANTPIASTLMAVELFGAETGAYAGLACVVAYLFSGQTGIYHAQRTGVGKRVGGPHEAEPQALVAKEAATP